GRAAIYSALESWREKSESGFMVKSCDAAFDLSMLALARAVSNPIACAHTWYIPESKVGLRAGKTYRPCSFVKTVVVMVLPGSFAETVTPSSGLPSADLITPASVAGWACTAPSRTVARTTGRRLLIPNPFRVDTGTPLFCASGPQSFQVGN